jgi:hypothetical protein
MVRSPLLVIRQRVLFYTKEVDNVGGTAFNGSSPSPVGFRLLAHPHLVEKRIVGAERHHRDPYPDPSSGRGGSTPQTAILTPTPPIYPRLPTLAGALAALAIGRESHRIAPNGPGGHFPSYPPTSASGSILGAFLAYCQGISNELQRLELGKMGNVQLPNVPKTDYGKDGHPSRVHRE